MKRSLWMGIGVAAMIGAALWMRELASWRPVVVKKVNHSVERLLFTNNGHYLFAAGRNSGLLIDVTRDAGDGSWKRISDFKGYFGVSKFPDVGADSRNWRFIFSMGRKNVALRSLFVRSPQHPWKDFSDGNNEVGIAGIGAMKRENGEFRFGWSLISHEVYGELNGEILIWNADNGKLKKRVRYAKSQPKDAVFSPNGKWLVVATQRDRFDTSFLRRYEVQTGKMVEQIAYYPGYNQLSFSPDGRFFCFALGSGTGTVGVYEFKVLDTFTSHMINQWRVVDGGVHKGPIKWISGQEFGVVTHKDFEWRNAASSKLLRSLPGPSGINDNISDWVLSPDGKWIYSAEQSGIIRRWRAR